MLENACDERLSGIGELQRVVRAVERVRLALEQAHVGVHRRAGVLGERLGHERRPDAVVERDLLDHVPERHHVVGHRQRVGVAQVDLLLAGRALVVAELHRDAHLLERVDGMAAEVRRRVVHGLVEVAAVVGGNRHRAVVGTRVQQEELDLGVHVAGEAEIAGLGQLAAQHVP